MDIATLVGILGAFGIIIGAIMTGGELGPFIDVPSMLIVVGGTFFVTFSQVTLGDFLSSFTIGLKSVLYKVDDPMQLIEESVQLADIARKNGLLALEGQEITNPFMQKGVMLCVDGHDPTLVKKMLDSEVKLTLSRHENGIRMFRNMATMAPAMGMIGTLVGLVQMLSNMSDPAAIGPAMAVALLTTLYGAIIANAFATPVADKLTRSTEMEELNSRLIIETISGIQEGMNPRILEQLLSTYLINSKRPTEEE
ncbi:MAG: flagellar motor protein PomA [Gammaproteobacteria bacterium]